LEDLKVVLKEKFNGHRLSPEDEAISQKMLFQFWKEDGLITKNLSREAQAVVLTPVHYLSQVLVAQTVTNGLYGMYWYKI